jgi:hypothetical protein
VADCPLELGPADLQTVTYQVCLNMIWFGSSDKVSRSLVVNLGDGKIICGDRRLCSVYCLADNHEPTMIHQFIPPRGTTLMCYDRVRQELTCVTGSECTVLSLKNLADASLKQPDSTWTFTIQDPTLNEFIAPNWIVCCDRDYIYGSGNQFARITRNGTILLSSSDSSRILGCTGHALIYGPFLYVSYILLHKCNCIRIFDRFTLTCLTEFDTAVRLSAPIECVNDRVLMLQNGDDPSIVLL